MQFIPVLSMTAASLIYAVGLILCVQFRVAVDRIVAHFATTCLISAQVPFRSGLGEAAEGVADAFMMRYDSWLQQTVCIR